MGACLQGELQERGGMNLVAEKIKQVELPALLLDQIMVEVDLDLRYLRLMKQLEDCVAFLNSFLSSTSSMNGETKLCSFIVEAMLVSPQAWKEISCASIDREVCLKHIKSLITGMDERQNGGEFYKLDSKYREQLSPEHVELLKLLVHKADNITLVLQALKDMMDMLSSPLYTAPSLKANLYYVGSGDELAGCAWYDQYFPESIGIENILETFRAINNML
jgi:hypothetical protein